MVGIQNRRPAEACDMKRAHYETLATHDVDYWWFQTRHDVVLRMLKKHQPLSNGLLVDVGCGTGGFLSRFLNESSGNGNVHGLDVDSQSIAIAADRGVRASTMTGQTPTADDVPSSPTAMTILDVLEHLDDPIAMLTSMHAIASPRCVLVALVPAMNVLWSPWDDRLGHRRRYDLRMIRSHVSEAGWTIQRARYIFPSMVIPGILRARLLNADKLPADEFPSVPGWVNCCLHWWTSLEARLPWWPIGSSLAVVATKDP
jgi:SAM-dependent methyltransferase